MTPAEILNEARAAGITLWAEGAALRYRGPSEALAKYLPRLKAHKAEILAALASQPSAPLHCNMPGLSPAVASRRERVLALKARDGTRYAMLVDDPDTDPVVMAMATPDGTCEMLIPRDRYDPFAVLAMLGKWETEPVNTAAWVERARREILKPAGAGPGQDAGTGGQPLLADDASPETLKHLQQPSDGAPEIGEGPL